MERIEITEGRPLSYTAADGVLITVSVAGPVEQIFTLTVGGERIDSSPSETWIRYQARGHAESHNARGGKTPASAPGFDGYEPESIDLDELRAVVRPALSDVAIPDAELYGRRTHREHSPTCNCQPHPIFGHEDACRYVGTGQIESPLPAAERQSSGLAGGGAAANAMSAPVRDMLVTAERFSGRVTRGRRMDGRYPLSMLRAAQRRGWLALDDQWMPLWGQITDASRKALARELASVGGAR